MLVLLSTTRIDAASDDELSSIVIRMRRFKAKVQPTLVNKMCFTVSFQVKLGS